MVIRAKCGAWNSGGYRGFTEDSLARHEASCPACAEADERAAAEELALECGVDVRDLLPQKKEADYGRRT